MQRRTILLSVLGFILLAAATAGIMGFAIRTPTGCAALPTTAEGDVTPVTLIVELQGNTTEDADSVETFVSSQLEKIATDPSVTYAVRIVFIEYGNRATLDGCLSEPRYIVPPKEDLATYEAESTSSDTKKQLASSMRTYRLDRVTWVADEAKLRTRLVSFEGRNSSKPMLSPRFIWNAAAAYDTKEGAIAMLSPLTSTVDDCFAPSKRSPRQQANDCIKYNQIGLLKARATSLVLEPSLLDTTSRARAKAMRDSLCSLATTDRCSVSP